MNKAKTRNSTSIILLLASTLALAQAPEQMKVTSTPGVRGGRLTLSQRAEAKTLNPVIAVDAPSREVIQRMHADLVHINRVSHRTEPALAKSSKPTPDGRTFTIELRRGIRFSDGQPFDADDVIFTFEVYLDETIHSPQRDLLVIAGKPLAVRKLGPYTVEFEFAQPYAAGDRVFDSIVMLPEHLLRTPYEEGRLGQVWTLDTPSEQIAGLGPFRLKNYTPGQNITLERNPYYWKTDQRGVALPYLNEINFVTVPNDDAQVLRFQTGETDIINRISAQNFAALARDQQKQGYSLSDVGPSLEYNFLLLNLNDDVAGKFAEIGSKQRWFRQQKFRQAVSLAIDRDGIVRLVYKGHGAPLWSHVTPGNKDWLNGDLPRPPRNLTESRALLQAAGFKWNEEGVLTDGSGTIVEFTIVAPANNAQRLQMATIIQQDLSEIGMRVQVVPLEFRALVERVTKTHDYDAAIMGLGSGDTDPTAEMNILLSTGSTHLWNLGQTKPSTPWEAEIDRLMQQQAITLDPKQRRRIYDRVQQIVAEQLPIICLASPNVLVGAKNLIRNFRPAVLDHYTLHNIEELFWNKK